MQDFIIAENIVKRFAEHTALDGVSIRVPRGKVFGLLGPNGAGKTTLIRIINHITMPDEGTVTFDGHDLRADDMLSIGYLPEERGLYKKMKVGEQAIYLARLKGLSEHEARRRLKIWFEKLGIMGWWNRKLEELSKGMQQKVQFIITILHEPPLLIFDEPFSGFDPVNAEILKKEILELRDKGHTILFSTHNMSSVEEICDDIALINHSKVVLQGPVDEIRERYKNNTYRVTIPAQVSFFEQSVCEVLGEETKGKEKVLTVRKPEGETNSQLLSHLAEQVEILGFEECLPSMNDIFIRVVADNELH
ncbi:MAG: ABC transporter ATP-binding protein [Bacteroidaceae bacterium]|jgi:ABC-2 type transport system ATP-binding protein|nr:ABC transporter ATP-binding protein [Bacteroidaceae bacterium]